MKNLKEPIKSLLELYIGMRVQDDEGNIGTVKECYDIHNIFVKFDNGGTGLYCLIEGCADNIRINDEDIAIPYYTPLYPYNKIYPYNKTNSSNDEDGNANFTFTVSDGFSTYEFPLELDDDNSVQGIAEKIYKTFKLENRVGRLVKGNEY